MSRKEQFLGSAVSNRVLGATGIVSAAFFRVAEQLAF